MQDLFLFQSRVKSFDQIFFDSHAHLQYPLNQDISQVVSEAKQVGLAYLICVGTDAKNSLQALNLHKQYPDYIFPTAGLHPYESQNEFQEIQALLAEHPEFVALGETGLDFYNCKIPKDIQIQNLIKHVKLAVQLDLPIILHLRPYDECFNDVMQILTQFQVKKAIFHCFSGSLKQAQTIWEREYKSSFACNVSYPKNKELLEIMQHCPLQNLLIETDTPYLAPQPVRGQPNTPANLKYLRPILENL